MLTNRLDNAFSNVIKDLFPYSHNAKHSFSHKGHTFPKTNIARNVDSMTIKIAAPGLSKDDFNITIEGKTTLGVKVAKDEESSCETLLQEEFIISNFTKLWTLPNNLNLEKVNADYIAGILTITIPTIQKKANVIKSITVN